jgi:spore coat-associated protein N
VTIKQITRTRAGKALLSLLVLALLALTLQSVVFSGASFVAGSANPGNAFTAGSLSHVNSRAGTFVLDATRIRPGQSKSGTLTIAGGGSVTGAYTISKANVVDTPALPGLSNTLTLRIRDVTGAPATLYNNGTVAAFTSVPAGSIAPGVHRTYEFTLTYPLASANSALQGDSMVLTLQFTGVSP